MDSHESSIFRHVPKTGVIYVMTEAAKRGFHTDREQWANLGQGAPETGDIPDCPSRVTSIPVSSDAHEYTPVGGLWELREAVAQLYNSRYRQGDKKKFSADHVAISSGGRLALTRVVATLGNSNVGHFLPDYTAYEELLGSFGTFIPIPIARSGASPLTGEMLEQEIITKGLSTVLLSNPNNPSGHVLSPHDLSHWVDVCRRLKCAIVFDEFYSHYIYDRKLPYCSAAEHIDDIDVENTVILDGLTKNWRYPGFRISWTIGPKMLIEKIASAGSFLDGGANHPTQALTVELLRQNHADAEAQSISTHFRAKRDYLCSALRQLGILNDPPDGSFYCWGDISKLPKSLNNCTQFFEAAIDKKLIVVPGNFFDINPGRRRPERSSQFEKYVRFSFGPDMRELERGVEILTRLIEEHS